MVDCDAIVMVVFPGSKVEWIAMPLGCDLDLMLSGLMEILFLRPFNALVIG